jgi:hypothetical protein
MIKRNPSTLLLGVEGVVLHDPLIMKTIKFFPPRVVTRRRIRLTGKRGEG